ncbi:hypothetical protein CAI18_05920 [Xanthomonas citri pv. punicae]|nr:hypothetical protein Xcnt_05050 [Xanthomonas campestris pv. centellae]QCZ65722.1 hypothetical protein CAI14_15250 [Xanthomonas citri pv. punicae]CCF70603.1 hypothetical protein XAPC_4340 [Xanthomonas citri pv. punicae str. LMG 859]CCG35888.1 hypothetical protein XMIN_847 [Xanthomonas citri pv. mangiferaeindicae LMG 941]QCZ69430.1 hypothetical protein CAI17_12885 [Xanthomonas citri pv. punicae]
MADAAPSHRQCLVRRGVASRRVASNSMQVLAFANSNAGNASECSDFSASDAAPQASVYAMATAIEH